MSAKTGIAWTDATWNPVRGCSLVSPGCTNCYAMKVAHRFSGAGMPYDGLTKATSHGPVWTGDARAVPDMLTEPLRWKKPRRIFVNSMSDLFHEDVSETFVERVFETMARAPQHTFQILTKRPKRMLDTVEWIGRLWSRSVEAEWRRWPLPNVWLGVSIEDQQRGDDRIPLLLKTPAAVRFLSCEPLLEAIDLSSTRGGTLWIGGQRGHGGTHRGPGTPECPRELHHHHDERCERGIDWIIVGGESGLKARPFNIQWARSIVAQCRLAGVPVFVKQLGARPYDFGARFDDSECVDSMVARMHDTIFDRAGADPSEWPEDLRVQEFPR